MKNNKKILIVLLMFVLLMTGCTKQLKNANGKTIQDKTTKQVLVENILCQPIELRDKYIEETKKIKIDYTKKYESGELSKKEYTKKTSNILDINKLPKCINLSITEGGYENLWTSVFIKPLAWVIIKVGKFLGNSYGLSIIIVTLLIKLILLPFSIKSLNQSENMKKAQPELSKLEKKYKDKNDQQSMMMKSNEMMTLYKKYKINPVSGCLLGLVQIPLFFAFYEALYRLPLLYEGKFLGFHMGMTPLAAIGTGNWIYAILPILVGVVTFFSFKMNKNTMPGDQAKQMNMMFNIMIVMIFITSFSMSTSIIIYWITNSLFTIIQNLLIKRSM